MNQEEDVNTESMPLDVELELRRRCVLEAIERRDKQAALSAVNRYLRVAFTLMELEHLADAREDD